MKSETNTLLEAATDCLTEAYNLKSGIVRKAISIIQELNDEEYEQLLASMINHLVTGRVVGASEDAQGELSGILRNALKTWKNRE